jgi:hypothetical protein
MWERLIDRCRPNTQKLYFRRNKPTRIQKYPTPRQKKNTRTGDDERERGEIERERRRRKEAREPPCLRGRRAGPHGRPPVALPFSMVTGGQTRRPPGLVPEEKKKKT